MISLALQAVFRESGAALDILETGENRAAGPKAKRAVAEGFDAIVVCGGDGTIFDVIQGLAGSAVPLGIIPFGTGNVMAQNLKVPKDPEDAARWILRSRPNPVPLGRITCCTAGRPANLAIRDGCRHGHACCPDVGSATFGKEQSRAGSLFRRWWEVAVEPSGATL